MQQSEASPSKYSIPKNPMTKGAPRDSNDAEKRNPIIKDQLSDENERHNSLSSEEPCSSSSQYIKNPKKRYERKSHFLYATE